MCGLVGVFMGDAGATVDKALLERMNARQAHRGPDAGGLHIEAGLGLAHRRLAIIDHQGGQQPLFNEDHSVVVVYNGEIYNFAALARQLTELGHRFRSHCDTEVIVHAWEEWGQDCVTRLRGMFAFALWDRTRQTLLLARDRLGIKPLYYTLLPGGELWFASELKALKCHPRLDRRLDEQAVEQYFALGYVADPHSIYRGVSKLAPGHLLCLRRGASLPAPQQYWDLPSAPDGPLPGVDAAAVELVERLHDAVGMSMHAEVPLGAFLSGGLDSGAIVAMLSRQSPTPVETCSIGFAEPAYDESGAAAAVARRYGTRHHVQQFGVADAALLDLLPGLYDEPFGDSSALPTYVVCALAARNLKVVLSGDGGDELFAGYRRYAQQLDHLALQARLPPGLGAVLGALGRFCPDHGLLPAGLRRRQGLLSMGQDAVQAYCDLNAVIKLDRRRWLYSAAFLRRLDGYSAGELFSAHAARAPGEDPLALVQYLDLKTYLPGDILVKVDRASMAHSLEVRVPMLDHPFVEWAFGLPSGCKRSAGEAKSLLRRAMRPWLPDSSLYGAKRGFAVPLATWLRGPLRERLDRALHSSCLHDHGLLRVRRLLALRDEHLSGRRDWSGPLWALMMFEAFLREEAG